MTEKNLLYNKQFGFQEGYSTDHAIFQLADQIHQMVHKCIYTIDIFTDMSKASPPEDAFTLWNKK